MNNAFKLLVMIHMSLLVSACHHTRSPELTMREVLKDPTTVSIFDQNRPAPYETIKQLSEQVSENSSIRDIADVLLEIDVVVTSTTPRQAEYEKIAEIEDKLVGRLRSDIKKEVTELHKKALRAAKYRDGYALARKAESLIVLYP